MNRLLNNNFFFILGFVDGLSPSLLISCIVFEFGIFGTFDVDGVWRHTFCLLASDLFFSLWSPLCAVFLPLSNWAFYSFSFLSTRAFECLFRSALFLLDFGLNERETSIFALLLLWRVTSSFDSWFRSFCFWDFFFW